eukprot:7386_1
MLFYVNYLFYLAVICIICSITIFAYLFHGLYISNSRHQIQSEWYKLPSLAACVFYVATSITYLLVSLSYSNADDFDSQNVSGYFFITVCLLISWLVLSKSSIYISILSRLYLTFRNSVYYVRKSMLHLMICVLVLFFLSGIYSNVLLYTKYKLENPPSNYYTQFEVVFISLIIYDFISSVVMLLLFISKLYKVILARRQISLASADYQSASSYESTLDDHDLKFIEAITKYTVLSCWQILTSQFGLLSLILAGMYVNWNNHYYGGVTHKRWHQMHYYFFTFISLDIMINSLALMLYYRFTSNIYFTLCGKLHKCCKGCFIWYADVSMRKRINVINADKETHPMLKPEIVS